MSLALEEVDRATKNQNFRILYLPEMEVALVVAVLGRPSHEMGWFSTTTKGSKKPRCTKHLSSYVTRHTPHTSAAITSPPRASSHPLPPGARDRLDRASREAEVVEVEQVGVDAAAAP